MNLELHFRNSDLAEALETYLERRLQFALSPFAGQLGRVMVRLAESGGPRGSSQKQCVITAETAGPGEVAASERNPDLYVAVDRAVRRLVRQLRRKVDRKGRPGPVTGAGFRRPQCAASWPGAGPGGAYVEAAV